MLAIEYPNEMSNEVTEAQERWPSATNEPSRYKARRGRWKTIEAKGKQSHQASTASTTASNARSSHRQDITRHIRESEQEEWKPNVPKKGCQALVLKRDGGK
jgi:hypothetical protein